MMCSLWWLNSYWNIVWYTLFDIRLRSMRRHSGNVSHTDTKCTYNSVSLTHLALADPVMAFEEAHAQRIVWCYDTQHTSMLPYAKRWGNRTDWQADRRIAKTHLIVFIQIRIYDARCYAASRFVLERLVHVSACFRKYLSYCIFTCIQCKCQSFRSISEFIQKFGRSFQLWMKFFHLLAFALADRFSMVQHLTVERNTLQWRNIGQS